MVVRPLEPEDVPLALALVDAGFREDAAEWGRRLDVESWDDTWRLGVWEDGLRGVATISPPTRPRAGHVGRVAVLGEAGPALAALVDAADRWLQLGRLEAELDAGDRGVEQLVAAGFAVEALKPGGHWPKDSVVLGRLRPGFFATPRPAPAWPEAAPGTLGQVAFVHGTAEHAPAFAALMRDDGVMWGTLQVPVTTVDSWRRRLGSNGPEHRVRLALVDGVPAGTFGVHPHARPFTPHVASMGMGIVPAFQGRGLGRLILDELLRLAFDELQLTRLELEVYPDNTRAVALYRRFGFVHEGVRRAAIFRDGGWVDSAVMGLVRPR